VALALLFDWLAGIVEKNRNKIIKCICIPKGAWTQLSEAELALKNPTPSKL